MKSPLSLVFGMVLLFHNSLSAATYYLYYDAACMSRLEYAFPETTPGRAYVVYALQVSNTEKLVLEVGIESVGNTWRTLPAAPIYCNSPEFFAMNNGMSDAINRNVNQVFVIYPLGTGQYRVTQVKTASVFRNDANTLEVNSEQYRFAFNKLSAPRTGDLSGNYVRGQVFYTQTVPYGNCNAYVFKKTTPGTNNTTDIYVVPSLGVVEERSGAAVSFKLQTINANDAQTALNAMCAREATQTLNPEFAPRGLTGYDQVKTPEATKVSRTHTVQPRESMYGIVKRYQLNFGDFMQWNRLNEQTVLQPGMVLLIEDPGVNERTTTKGGDSPLSSYDVLDSRSNKSDENAWLSAPDVYTVQKGETAASIAKKLGFTEARFRYFNNLPDNLQLREGDMVKTGDCAPSTIIPSPGKTSPFYESPWDMGTQPGAALAPENVPAPYDYAPAAVYPGSRSAVVEPFSTKGVPPVLQQPTLTEFNWSQPSNAAPARGSSVQRLHVVREGETLLTIARRYGLTEQQLRTMNNMGPGETIIEFQTIRVN
ncbi:MAG: LysM peptidoglycan-binding domain-containing protein [Saprospiraceae bacterium]